MQAFYVFYDAENCYYIEADDEADAALVAAEEYGPDFQYIEATELQATPGREV